MATQVDAIPFEAFVRFERLPGGSRLLFRQPPEWAAAAHAIVVGETVHYIWARRRADNSWLLMHSHAPTCEPAAVEHDPRNPILVPSEEGFDNYAVEYPFPFRNPTDGKFCVYYLGHRGGPPKQTGLLVTEGDFAQWRRVTPEPVIRAEADHESHGASHPSVAVVGDTIHVVYTGESAGQPVICHATAPTSDPARVEKDPANPAFIGSGQEWDSRGVREAEILKGPRYFHIFYGGSDGTTWRIGHVRTRDFRTFEPNPHNPIFTPSPDRDAWDCDGVLTPQVFQSEGVYYMLYAGKRGREWQSGLALAR